MNVIGRATNKLKFYYRHFIGRVQQARFVGQGFELRVSDLPRRAIAGFPMSASVCIVNTSSQPRSEATFSLCAHWRLAHTPEDSFLDDLTHAVIGPLAPGEKTTFPVVLTAPDATRAYELVFDIVSADGCLSLVPVGRLPTCRIRRAHLNDLKRRNQEARFVGQAAGCALELHVAELPRHATQNGPLVPDVTVVNTGLQSWPSGLLSVGVHWRQSGQTDNFETDLERADIPALAPGEQTTFPVPLTAPTAAHEFELLFDVVSTQGTVLGLSPIGRVPRCRVQHAEPTDFGNRPNPVADHLRRMCLETFLRDPSRRLNFPQSQEPMVSILVLNYNHDSKLLECLSSILAHTREVPYELIVADNASSDRGPELLQRLTGVKVLSFKENLGFVRGNNAAAKLARGKYLLLLNNDTIVTPGWLSALLDVMQRFPGCGAVGPLFLYPDGRLQEAGSLVHADGRVNSIGCNDNSDPLSDLYAHIRTVDYCSAACLLVRTDFFNDRGGFDERFAPAYYEDVDLGMAVWDAGMKVFYQPSSVVIHHGPTSGNLTRVADLTTANQKKFFAKWRKRLTQHSNGRPT